MIAFNHFQHMLINPKINIFIGPNPLMIDKRIYSYEECQITSRMINENIIIDRLSRAIGKLIKSYLHNFDEIYDKVLYEIKKENYVKVGIIIDICRGSQLKSFEIGEITFDDMCITFIKEYLITLLSSTVQEFLIDKYKFVNYILNDFNDEETE